MHRAARSTQSVTAAPADRVGGARCGAHATVRHGRRRGLLTRTAPHVRPSHRPRRAGSGSAAGPAHRVQAPSTPWCLALGGAGTGPYGPSRRGRPRPDGPTQALQRYDVQPTQRPGEWEERYWSPVNAPVLDHDGKVVLIVHRVEEVTQLIAARGAPDGSRSRVLEGELYTRARELQKSTTDYARHTPASPELETTTSCCGKPDTNTPNSETTRQRPVDQPWSRAADVSACRVGSRRAAHQPSPR